MSELELIGQGWTTKVYREGNKAIKMYIDPPPNEVQMEAKKQQFAYNLGLTVPAVYGVRVVNEHTVALDMEFIDGKIIGDETIKDEDIPGIVQILVELHIRIHSNKAVGLTSMYEQLIKKINRSSYLESTQKEKLVELIQELTSDSNSLCHGDFHPMNVIYDGSQYWIIDWVDATAGNPLADVCRSCLLFECLGFSEAADIYMKAYCKATGTLEEDVLAFRPILAAVRLEENISEKEREYLKKIITDWENSKT